MNILATGRREWILHIQYRSAPPPSEMCIFECPISYHKAHFYGTLSQTNDILRMLLKVPFEDLYPEASNSLPLLESVLLLRRASFFLLSRLCPIPDLQNLILEFNALL